MIKNIKYALLIATLGLSSVTMAGNKDRRGQAGAYELLINPFSRSSGWGGINSASIAGLEATRMNVGGLARTTSTEIIVSRNVWLQLKGANVGVVDAGFAQPLDKNGGVLGINIMSMNFGEIPITTTETPDVVNGNATLGTYKPQFLNVGLSYAKTFSNSIRGGVGFTLISESVPNAKAQGVAVDAGIQYTTGKKENIHFGIALRNVGTPMRFTGDGLSFQGLSPNQNFTQTQEQRSERLELPSQLSIAAAYDYKFSQDDQRVSFVGKFNANAFSRDQIGLGVEYAYKTYLMLRTGYNFEGGMFKNTQRTNVYTGLSAGLTFEVPLKKDGPTLGIDYSYRTTNPFNGTHSIGLRFALN